MASFTTVVLLAAAIGAAASVRGAGVCPPQHELRDSAAMELFVDALAEQYPKNAARHDIGTSYQGRPLVGVRVGAAVRAGGERDALVPSVHVIGQLHGDETMGRELSTQLACALAAAGAGDLDAVRAAGYDDDGVRLLVALANATDVQIVPSLNPDGFELGPRRTNAQGLDLNRSFPDPWRDSSIRCERPGEDGQRAPEVCAVVDWLADDASAHVLGVTLHAGALIMIVPYDGVASDGSNPECVSEDAAVYSEVARRYVALNGDLQADGAVSRPPTPPGPDFGVLRGCQWFPAYGTSQAYAYRFADALHTTFEVSVVKNPKPPAEQIAHYWSTNRDALAAYVGHAHIGVRGVVRDAESGAPLPHVRVTLAAGGSARAVHSHATHGDYFRPLAPGDAYQLRFDADGYEPHVTPPLRVGRGPFSVLRHDVVLEAIC